LDVKLFGRYEFAPGDVVAIKRHSRIPVLCWGIQIEHCIPDYPARLIFWTLRNPDSLLAKIGRAGFKPSGNARPISEERGFAIRWQAIVVLFVIWNLLMFLDFHARPEKVPQFGLPTLLAVAVLLGATVATIRIPAFRELVLKPGRRFGEIRPLLSLLLVVSSALFAGVLLINILRITR